MQTLCPLLNHEKYPIIALCLKLKCNSQAYVCQRCIKNIHANHVNQLVYLDKLGIYLEKKINLEKIADSFESLTIAIQMCLHNNEELFESSQLEQYVTEMPTTITQINSLALLLKTSKQNPRQYFLIAPHKIESELNQLLNIIFKESEEEKDQIHKRVSLLRNTMSFKTLELTCELHNQPIMGLCTNITCQQEASYCVKCSSLHTGHMKEIKYFADMDQILLDNLNGIQIRQDLEHYNELCDKKLSKLEGKIGMIAQLIQKFKDNNIIFHELGQLGMILRQLAQFENQALDQLISITQDHLVSTQNDRDRLKNEKSKLIQERQRILLEKKQREVEEKRVKMEEEKQRQDQLKQQKLQKEQEHKLLLRQKMQEEQDRISAEQELLKQKVIMKKQQDLEEQRAINSSRKLQRQGTVISVQSRSSVATSIHQNQSQRPYNNQEQQQQQQQQEQQYQQEDKSQQSVKTVSIKSRVSQSIDQNLMQSSKTKESEEQKVERIFKDGQQLYYQQKYAEAIQIFDEILQFNPKYFECLYCKGMSLFHQTKYLQALDCYEKASKIKPMSYIIINCKGQTLNALGRIQEAEKCFDQVLELNPKYPKAYYYKGLILHKDKKYEEALQFYEKVIALDPNNIPALNNIGSIYHKLKKYQEAIDYYDIILQKNPNDGVVVNNKELALKRLEKSTQTTLDKP